MCVHVVGVVLDVQAEPDGAAKIRDVVVLSLCDAIYAKNFG